MKKRLVVAAGGTGGHFFPGVSLASVLAARGWEPLFLVRKGDPALARLAPLGMAGLEVDLRGLPRRVSPELIAFGLRLGGALKLVRHVLRDFSPDVVVGMGGYLTFPLIFAAAVERRPRLVHESNAVLGLANRSATALGARLVWGLPPLSGKGEVLGTPIRRGLWKPGEPERCRAGLGLDPGKTTVLVFGGSQGARGINREAPAALKALSQKAPAGFQVLHLAGANDSELARSGYAGAAFPVQVKDFLPEMELAYGAADLVVCRSGASTLAELAAQKKPAVLIPFPSAAGGHQEDNARLFERAGAARLLLERELSGRLAGTLEDLIASPEAARRRSEMARAYARVGLPEPEQAAERLADAVESLARGKSS